MMILALMFALRQKRSRLESRQKSASSKKESASSKKESASSKREQLRALVSKLNGEIDDYIQTCSPYGGFLDRLMEQQTYDDPELTERNRVAGEISLLVYLLEQVRGISIIDDIREEREWETLKIPVKLNGFAATRSRG